MIVPMKHLTVLCTAADKEAALETLRNLAVLHVTAESGAISDGGRLAAAEASLSAAKKALEIAKSQKPKTGCKVAEKSVVLNISPEDVIERANAVDALSNEVKTLEKNIALYSHFGDFKPSDAQELADKGFAVTLFKAQASAELKAGDNALLKILDDDATEKLRYGVIIGDSTGVFDISGVEMVALPAEPLASMRKKLADKQSALAVAINTLESAGDSCAALEAALEERLSARNLAAAAATMGAESGIVWITGYCPEDDLPAISKAAATSGWGIAARNPQADENPPTLLRPPRIFRPITSLFKMLEIAPGYREVDLSAVFYGFFTIFFAMLVGDFGYGAIMLAATLFFRRKAKSAPVAPFILLTVFSVATCIWGVLSCNYFGAHPESLNFGVSKWLNDPSYTNIMKLCFLLGAIHLTIARLWSAVMLWPNTKALAEIGWAGVIWTMYCTSCAVVIPTFAFPKFMFVVAPVSILLIFLFMLSREELKTEGINLAILPLNIISCLGDIISYVRLFAVGLASVKVAENFNMMALDMNLPLVVKIPVVVLILLAGHGLNLAMGALSILVHAVRLNTLEFSNHKGISWSGYGYAPLKGK